MATGVIVEESSNGVDYSEPVFHVLDSHEVVRFDRCMAVCLLHGCDILAATVPGNVNRETLG